jgi:hypothetical protein
VGCAVVVHSHAVSSSLSAAGLEREAPEAARPSTVCRAPPGTDVRSAGRVRRLGEGLSKPWWYNKILAWVLIFPTKRKGQKRGLASGLVYNP